MNKKEQKKLLPMTSDLVFKAVLARETTECKTALISLLNAILGGKERQIIDLIYLNPFHYQEYSDDKVSIMDIEVELEDKSRICVEMQVAVSQAYINRAMFYCAKLMMETLNHAQDYKELRKSIVISILNERLFKQTKQAHTIFRFKEIDENFELSERSELHFIELIKVDMGKEVNQMSDLEKWATYIKCAEKEEYEGLKNRLMKESEGIQVADTMLRKISEDERVRSRERSRLMFMMDQNTLALEREEAMQEREEAMQEKAEAMQEKAEAMQEKAEAMQEKAEAIAKAVAAEDALEKAKAEKAKVEAARDMAFAEASKTKNEKKQIALKLLEKGMGMKEISEITGIPESEMKLRLQG